jgi:hypothetical protein
MWHSPLSIYMVRIELTISSKTIKIEDGHPHTYINWGKVGSKI